MQPSIIGPLQLRSVQLTCIPSTTSGLTTPQSHLHPLTYHKACIPSNWPLFRICTHKLSTTNDHNLVMHKAGATGLLTAALVMWGIITLVRVLIRYQNFRTGSPHGHLRRPGPRLRIYERVMQPTSLTTLCIVAYSNRLNLWI